MKSKNTGTAFEDAIATQCVLYEKQGIAKIEKTPIPSKFVYFNGTLQLVPIKKKGEEFANPWLDFAGCRITPTGDYHIVIECKDIDDVRLAINNERGGIKKSEFEAIQKWVAAGSIVLVLWYRQSCHECRIMDGEYIIDSYVAGNKSIRWDICNPVKDYDFLKAIGGT